MSDLNAVVVKSNPAGPFDAAVVGAGPNGLAAALRLQSAGLRVVVYERSGAPGGGMRTEALTLPGFLHDTCSAVLPMALSSPAIQRLGLEAEGLRWVQPPAPFAHPRLGAPTLTLERGLDETAQQLGVDAGRYSSWIRPFVERWAELSADALGPPGLPGAPILMARFGLRALLPAEALSRISFRGPEARALFAGVAGHSVLPLGRAPSAAIGLMLQAAGHAVGWPLPAGGAGALAAAMAQRFVAGGGALRLGVKVEALGAVETDGPVLFDTGPRALAAIAGEALPAAYRARLGRFRYGPGLFKVDWALSGPIPWTDPAALRAATVHLGDSLESIVASEAACWRGEVMDRPYIILVQPSLFDPSRAPAGQHTAWAYCHVPSGDPRDHTERIEAEIERHAPGFGDRVRARHRSGPAELERLNPNYVGGDVNGGAADLDQLFTRPVLGWPPYATPNPRLYLCSASTPPGGGVHGMCGDNAAGWVLRRHFGQPSPAQLEGGAGRRRAVRG